MHVYDFASLLFDHLDMLDDAIGYKECGSLATVWTKLGIRLRQR